MFVAGAVIAGVASFVAAPFVQMARQGTLDQQKVAALRAEIAAATPVVPVAEVAIPAPRTSPESLRLAA